MYCKKLVIEVLSEKECINWMNENGYTENCMYKERENNG